MCLCSCLSVLFRCLPGFVWVFRWVSVFVVFILASGRGFYIYLAVSVVLRVQWGTLTSHLVFYWSLLFVISRFGKSKTVWEAGALMIKLSLIFISTNLWKCHSKSNILVLRLVFIFLFCVGVSIMTCVNSVPLYVWDKLFGVFCFIVFHSHIMISVVVVAVVIIIIFLQGLL